MAHRDRVIRPRALGRLCSLLFVMGCLVSCTDDELTLVVDLRTDFVPAVEFDAIEVELHGADTQRMEVSPDEAYRSGVRVGDWIGLTPDRDRGIEVRLMLDGELIDSRAVLLDHQTDLAVSVVMTRSCRGVVCEGESTCVGGVCQDPRCLTGSELECSAPRCEADGDCADPAAVCASARCVSGLCYSVPEAGCEIGEICHPDLDCVSLETRSGITWTMSSAEDLSIVDLGADDAGNVVMVGRFWGMIRVNSGQVGMASPNGSGFAMGLGLGPEPGWFVDARSSNSSDLRDLAVSPDGRMAAFGFSTGDATIDGMSYPFGARQAPFLLLLGADGAVERVEVFPSSAANAQGQGVGFDGSRVAVAGAYGGALNVAGVELPRPPNDVGYGALIDETNTARFAYPFSGSSNTRLNGADLIADRACFGGRIEGDGSYEGGTVTGPSGRTAGLLTCYDNDGALLWDQAIQSSGNDTLYGLTLLPDGAVVAMGAIGGAAMVDGAMVASSAGGRDGFVAVFEADGSLRWFQAGGGPVDDDIGRVAVSPTGTLAVTGLAREAGTWGGVSLPAGGIYWELDLMTGESVRPPLSIPGATLAGVAWLGTRNSFVIGGSTTTPVSFAGTTFGSDGMTTLFVVSVP